MAKNRLFNTHFWRDSFTRSLSRDERLVYVYLLTSPETTIAGFYETTPEQIALDTGVELEDVRKAMHRLSEDKIAYRDGWVVLLNFYKHQRLNPKTKIAVENALNDAPDWVYIAYTEPIDRLSRLNLNLNLNLNSKRDSYVVSTRTSADDEEILELYARATGNKTTKRDATDLAGSGLDTVPIKIGILTAVEKVRGDERLEPIRSLRYCLVTAENELPALKATGAGESYLEFLEAKLAKRERQSA